MRDISVDDSMDDFPDIKTIHGLKWRTVTVPELRVFIFAASDGRTQKTTHVYVLISSCNAWWI